MAIYSEDFLENLPDEPHLAGFEVCNTFLDHISAMQEQVDANAALEFYALYTTLVEARNLNWFLPSINGNSQAEILREVRMFAEARRNELDRYRVKAANFAAASDFRRKFRQAMQNAFPENSERNRTTILQQFFSIPTWTSLNSLGRNRVLKSSYVWIVVVPIGAKLFSAIRETLTFTILDAEIAVNPSLPFSWEMFYFSAVFIGAGSLIYFRYCPDIVSKYDRLSDFTAEGKGSKQLRESLLQVAPAGSNMPSHARIRDGMVFAFMKYFGLVGGRTFPTVEGENELLVTYDEFLNAKTNAKRDKDTDSNLANEFWYVRDCANRYAPNARRICFLCYFIGLIFLAIVLIENFLYVFLQVWS